MGMGKGKDGIFEYGAQVCSVVLVVAVAGDGLVYKVDKDSGGRQVGACGGFGGVGVWGDLWRFQGFWG